MARLRLQLGFEPWHGPRLITFTGQVRGAVRQFLDDRRLANARLALLKTHRLTQLVDRVLNVVNVAVQLIDLGRKPLHRILRAFPIRHDQ